MNSPAENFELMYVEIAEAIGYVNRSESGSGYAIADHATIMDAVKSIVAGEVDAEECMRMAAERDAAVVQADELRCDNGRLRLALGHSAKAWRQRSQQVRDTLNVPGNLGVAAGMLNEADHCDNALQSKPSGLR